MKDTSNITIALLLATAVILATMLIAVYNPTPAYADASIKQGDYMMSTGAWSRSTDLLYILDIASRKLNVYHANTQTSAIDLITNADLSRAFGEVGGGRRR